MSKAVITGSAANRHIKEVIHVITGVDVDTVQVNTQQQQTEQPLLTARVDNQIAVVKKYVDDKVAEKASKAELASESASIKAYVDEKVDNLEIPQTGTVHSIPDNVVTEDGEQTLTNKTIDGLSCSFQQRYFTFQNKADTTTMVYCPNVFDRVELVGEDTTQTLSNKILDSTNTFPSTLATVAQLEALEARIQALEEAMQK